MRRVLVLDTNAQPLMPCHPARAKELLDKGKAAVYRRFPFTIILKYAVQADNQPLQVKVDPGSRTTGIALVAEGQRGRRVVWAAELQHRGQLVHEKLVARAQLRRGRRSRKTRYRPPRFNNRRRPEGGLPPSLRSRVQNVQTWIARLCRFAPVSSISLEVVRFDTQALERPEIDGVEYQQGTLWGYEVREYLLEKWGRTCAYCGTQNVPLEIEHIVPKSRGGSDRVSNLTLACTGCNQDKGNRTTEEYGFPHIQAQARRPLKDAAAVNSTRFALWRWCCDTFALPVEVGTGGRTKYNRSQQGYPKAHWIDAACVGASGAWVYIAPNSTPLLVKATGRGSRQMCRLDRYGFPRTSPKHVKRVHGFQTGDIVRAVVPKGQHAGTHTGRVAVRASGRFRVGPVDGISWRHCCLLHRTDGYEYPIQKGLEAHSFPA
ncbi:MAG: RRXRR domain-containing protein [Anaerolineae bacterium]|nr:RRXRR domain-containing protein [Anaerolineae bacterium]